MARPERLGPYKIQQPIGKGGMGHVYSAVHDETGQRVAVKALSPELAMSEGFRERFEAEIESLKLLRHAGIVQLYGYGEEQGVLFYSMELVNGASLDEELRAGRRFNWREVAQIASQVSRALKHAHDHGIIHRDIKPANILLDQNERVKLADFGIARLFGYSQLTAAGGILGTADYMSPEQADGRPVTDRCDQYSLGCVMYALLAGRPPFRAKTLPEMLQMQRYANPEPVRRYAPQTPLPMENAIAQLLSKMPEDRFPNTVVLAKHLEAMTLALTKPARDAFHVADDQEDDSPESLVGMGLKGGDEDSMSLAVTQVESTDAEWDDSISIDAPPLETGSGNSEVAPHASGSRANDDPTLLADGEVTDPQGKASPPELANPPSLAGRFTIVGEDAGKLERGERWWRLAQIAVGGLALTGLGYGAALWLAPPTADELYRTISAISLEQWATGDEEARRVLDQFEQRYPDDPRQPQVEPFRQQLQTADLGRRLRAAYLRGDSFEQQLTAEEQLYLDALRVARDDPPAAIERLQQLIALLAPTATDASGRSERQSLMALAEQQIEQIVQAVADDAALQLPFLEERLQAAREMQESSPKGAAASCRAIIALYGDELWAKEAVREARELLAAIEDQP